MSNIFQVAAKCGVSTSTVSRVFNQRARVSAATRAQVLAVAQRLHYRPKYTARRDRILVVLSGEEQLNLGNYISQILLVLTSNLIKRKLAFDILPLQQALLVHPNFMQGVLAVLHRADQLMLLDQFRDIPVLTINRPRTTNLRNRHAVYVNQRQGMELALAHLAGHGHRRVGLFLYKAAKTWAVQERWAAYQAGVRRWHLSADPRLVCEPSRPQYYLDTMAQVLRAGATAVIVPSEDEGLPLNYAMYTLGKRVPDDLSLITYESPEISPLLTPPHTTVSQNLAQLGALAVETMAQLIAKPASKPISIELENTLIERESVKSLK